MTLGDSIWNAASLLYGKGLPVEGVASSLSKILVRDLKMPALADDFGQVLVFLDWERGPAEVVLTTLRNSPQGETLRTIDRALYLQRIGLIPKSVRIPLYVLNNRRRGISDQTILTTLLIRGGIELHTELTELKAKPAPIETTQTITPKKDDSLLVDEKKRHQELEKENTSLRKELSDAHLESSSLKLRNDNLCNHIVDVSKRLTALSADMNKIEKPSFDAMAVKAIVYDNIIPIATMNYLTWNSNKSDA